MWQWKSQTTEKPRTTNQNRYESFSFYYFGLRQSRNVLLISKTMSANFVSGSWIFTYDKDRSNNSILLSIEKLTHDKIFATRWRRIFISHLKKHIFSRYTLFVMHFISGIIQIRNKWLNRENFSFLLGLWPMINKIDYFFTTLRNFIDLPNVFCVDFGNF